ncbi:MAG: hypothetical protein HXY34_11490 [Candidatus Thorarchaeota archaeon]|nr:hypothetical protein [Candidatus Thorarchaeota archaeon]
MSDESALRGKLTALREALGLSEAEVSVLLPLYIGGNMTAGAIALILGDNPARVEKTLEGLVEKGLAVKSEGILPLYRGLSLCMSAGPILSSARDELKSFAEKTGLAVESHISGLDSLVDELLTVRQASTGRLREGLEAYDLSVAKAVHDQITEIAEAVRTLLQEFSKRVESVLAGVEVTLDNNLGEGLTALQGELDQIQKTLSSELNGVSAEFDQWVQSELSSTTESADRFSAVAGKVVHETKKVVMNALSQSAKAVRSAFSSIGARVSGVAAEKVRQLTPVMDATSSDILHELERLEAAIARIHESGREAIKNSLVAVRNVHAEQAAEVRAGIAKASESVHAMSEDIDAWKAEVAAHIESTVTSLTKQLEQVAHTDKSYHDSVVATITEHLESSNQQMDTEYQSIQELVSKTNADLESALGEAKNSILQVLESESQIESTRFVQVRDTLIASLDKLAKSTAKSLAKQVSTTAADVSSLLDTEVNELTGLAESMSNRLKSAFSSIVSSGAAKGQATLTTIRKTAQDLDSSVGSKLDEMVSAYATSTKASLEEVISLYEELKSRIDERLAQGVSRIGSHTEKAQKAIDVSVQEQIGRIERQAQEMRAEFHGHVEELTKRFAEMVAEVESAFNGMISSQALEARDTITSAHAELTNSLRSEVSVLKEDSVKIREEFASQIAARVAEASLALESIRKQLESLIDDNKAGISQSVEDALEQIEASLKTVHDALKEIESSTVSEVCQDLLGAAQAFKKTVSEANAVVTQRLDSARDSLESALVKSIDNVRALTEKHISDHIDTATRVVAETSKSLDALSKKTMESATERLGAYHKALAERQTQGVKSRAALLDTAAASIASFKTEASQAIDASSVWFETKLDDFSTSLTSLGVKLANAVDVVQRTLQRSDETTSRALTETGEANADKIQELLEAVLNQVEGAVTASIEDLSQKSASVIQKATKSLNGFEKSVKETVAAEVASASADAEAEEKVVQDSLSAGISDITAEIKAATDAYRKFVDTLVRQAGTSRDAVIERTQGALVAGNVQSYRRLEAAAIVLKKKLGDAVHELTESVRNEVSSISQRTTQMVTRATTSASEAGSVFLQTRNDLLGTFETTSDKSLRKWGGEVKVSQNQLGALIKSAALHSANALAQILHALESVHSASTELSKVSASDTWYLSGREEILAYIHDMAQRAEESILISVPDLTLVDIKKLAKVKEAGRRVLVVPLSEETEETPEQLPGWRVWREKSPPLLSVRDDKEMVLGSVKDIEKSIALVTVSPGYLGLFHDLLGPSLVREAKK